MIIDQIIYDFRKHVNKLIFKHILEYRYMRIRDEFYRGNEQEEDVVDCILRNIEKFYMEEL